MISMFPASLLAKPNFRFDVDRRCDFEHLSLQPA